MKNIEAGANLDSLNIKVNENYNNEEESDSSNE